LAIAAPEAFEMVIVFAGPEPADKKFGLTVEEAA
jgi:ethanolamine utilization microcompartment shell protein EutL